MVVKPVEGGETARHLVLKTALYVVGFVLSRLIIHWLGL